MTHQLGDRAACDCGRLLIYTSEGWKHGGLGATKCVPNPVAMPMPDPDEPAWSNGVWAGDAPEDDEAEDDRILVKSGVLPLLIDAATNTLRRPEGMTWEQELAAIGEPDIPPLPPSVADLYRVIDEQLPTAAGKTQLKAFWLLMAEDSRLLDWLEKNMYKHHRSEQSGFSTLTFLDMMQPELRPLREVIKERMGAADAQ